MRELEQGSLPSSNATMLFALNEEGTQRLLSYGVPKTFPARSMVIHENDEDDALYVVLEGRVKCYSTNSEGKEFVFGTIGAGNYFGEMALDGGRRSTSVVTLEASRFLVVPRQRVDEMIGQYPHFARDLIMRLIGRVRHLTETAMNLAYQDAYGRVVRFLNASAVQEGEKLVVRERLTQTDIAAPIGGSREMVSRIMTDGGRRVYLEQFETDRYLLSPSHTLVRCGDQAHRSRRGHIRPSPRYEPLRAAR